MSILTPKEKEAALIRAAEFRKETNRRAFEAANKMLIRGVHGRIVNVSEFKELVAALNRKDKENARSR